MSRNDPALKPRKRVHHTLRFPFNELKETRKLFQAFVKTDWETNDHFYLNDGEPCVDFIIRYENLADDFKTLCKRVGLAELDLPRLKSGFRNANHYTQCYDERSKALVAERHANDIRLFGYRFETT